MKLAAIGAFGLVGVFSRYFLSHAVDSLATPNFPFGTLTVNLLGAFLAGMIVALAAGSAAFSPELKEGLIVGFLGGFTTFSALCQQTVQLYQEGRPGQATIYLVASNLAGVACVALGFGAARLIR